MVIRDVERHSEITQLADSPFTTSRLLVGDMLPAAKTLKNGMNKLLPPLSFYQRFFPPKYAVIMHPKAMTEGGLSSVEKNAFRDLATFICTSKNNASIYVCEHSEDLTDTQILDVLTGGFKEIKPNQKIIQ